MVSVEGELYSRGKVHPAEQEMLHKLTRCHPEKVEKNRESNNLHEFDQNMVPYNEAQECIHPQIDITSKCQTAAETLYKAERMFVLPIDLLDATHTKRCPIRHGLVLYSGYPTLLFSRPRGSLRGLQNQNLHPGLANEVQTSLSEDAEFEREQTSCCAEVEDLSSHH